METKTNGIAKIDKLPTLAELVTESPDTIKQNNLMVLLNQPPPKEWVKQHPMTKGDYLPIERVEYLLNRIFIRWWSEVRSVVCIANSVAVTVRLYVINPITGKEEWSDGIGAMAIQTDKGSGAMDWNHAKSDGVMKAAPAAETYAIKDAAEKWGKLFGKDLNRKEEISFDSLLKTEPVAFSELFELWELKKDDVPADAFSDCERVILKEEKKSFNKLFKYLQTL